MCLILFAYKTHPKYKLVVAANRDEFYSRPTEPAMFWEDKPLILAGKDLTAGGTWMGVSKQGKISMLTNYRDLKNIKQNAPSRGHLVSDFLENEVSAYDYLQRIAKNGNQYNGFNLICGTVDELYYYGNYKAGIYPITSGYHGLSNALLDTQWPKVDKGMNKLREVLKAVNIDPGHLFESLYDDIKAPEHLLPDTGVGIERESMLSPMFIKSPDYGSRCSTVLLVSNDNDVRYLERTYNTTDFSYIDRAYELTV
ncbi:NRDE family protein [Fulvivirga sp. 29W222]|uniref:NRDE family protein n=1 Tax=Fulvivirga marina TaxID=2494733 RepID=A0A937FZG6_9BACT|nr:NRDE family protein [Fulvivirga marina]MBL6447195.1 NRDE family protein [Fulvivirga marina]